MTKTKLKLICGPWSRCSGENRTYTKNYNYKYNRTITITISGSRDVGRGLW